LPHFWAFVTAFALFKIEPVVRVYCPWCRKQVEKISPLWRNRIEIAILIVAPSFMLGLPLGTKNI
jgi:hypothetical protein